MQLMENIVKLRKEKNVSQRAMAELLNTTQNQYWKYENEKQELPIRHLITIAKFFNTTTDEIIGLTPLTNNITEEELNVIELYRKLNEKKKGKAERYIEELIEQQTSERK